MNNFYSPYELYLETFPELKSKKFIGGWEEENTLHLWYREDGQRKFIVIPYIPRYFCIHREDFKKIKRNQWNIWKELGLFKKGEFHGDYGYIISDYTGYRKEWNQWLTILKELGVEPLEGDVSRLHRLIIDLELQVVNPNDNEEIRPHICYWDLETDDTSSVIHAGEDRILSCAIKDYWSGDEFFYSLEEHTDESEIEFLFQVYNKLLEFDVIIGYNTFGFDEEVIKGRMAYLASDKLDIKKWKRMCSIDYFNQLERQGTFTKYESKNRKLDTIGKAVVERGKLEHKEKIIDLWKTDKDLLKEYNLEDVRLLYDMEKKLNTANLVMNMISLSGILYNISHSPLKLIETALMRKAVQRRKMGTLDFRYPSAYYLPEHNTNGKYSPFAKNALASDKRKGRKEILEEEFGIEYNIEGGYVLESEPGFYRNVYSFDFISLYPNVKRAFNIDHTTILDENTIGIPFNITPNGQKFRIDRDGLMPELATKLLEERKKIRGQMKLENDPTRLNALDVLQGSVKILANSIYGTTGLWGCRLFNEKIGNAITSFGRFALPFGDEYFGASNRKVVVADTDSMYIIFKEGDEPNDIINRFNSLLQSTVKKKYNSFHSDVLKMEWQRTYMTLLILAKKSYAGLMIYENGVYYNPPKLDLKGLQIKKSTTCKWASITGKQILHDLLSGLYEADHYERILDNKRCELVSGKINLNDLLLSSRLGKELDEYSPDRALVHVSIAKRMKENGLLVSGHDTINYLITEGNTPMQGLGELEINGKCKVDAVYYYNIQFLQIIEPLLSIVFPDIDWKGKYAFPKKIKKTNFFEIKVEVTR